MTKPEAEWLAGARRLDEEALEAIYATFSPELYRYAFRLLGESQAAEDLVSETFYRLLRVLQAGGGPRDHLRAYLYRVAHNLAMDHHRCHSLQEEPLNDKALQQPASTEPDQVVEQSLAQAEARTALWHLTPNQRQVITLKFFQGLNNQEVAAVLNKPVGAVKSLQHRALNALHRMLEPDQDQLEKTG